MRKFNNSFPGYNKNEVNSFVSNVTTEYESMLNNLKNRDKEIESLKKELEHYKELLKIKRKVDNNKKISTSTNEK